MKQNITLEQLNELSDKGIKKLAKWFGLEEFDATSINVWRKSQGDYGTGNLLLSIGQLIEYLDEQLYGEAYDAFLATGRTKEKKWSISLWLKDEKYPNTPVKLEKSNVELCDALWEAVKEVLEK